MHYLQILHWNNLQRRIQDLFDIHVKLKKTAWVFFPLPVCSSTTWLSISAEPILYVYFGDEILMDDL